MKKNKFIKDLRTGLHSLPKEEIDDIIADFLEILKTTIFPLKKSQAGRTKHPLTILYF